MDKILLKPYTLDEIFNNEKLAIESFNKSVGASYFSRLLGLFIKFIFIHINILVTNKLFKKKFFQLGTFIHPLLQDDFC